MRLVEKTITFTVAYKVFEPGEMIKPTSSRCPLAPGIYKVVRCVEPLLRDGECPESSQSLSSLVQVEGHDSLISTDYLDTVKE